MKNLFYYLVLTLLFACQVEENSELNIEQLDNYTLEAGEVIFDGQRLNFSSRSFLNDFLKSKD